MSHPATHPDRYRGDDWVEPSDEPQGTAVFDATGDVAAMPSWDELVRQHADRVYRLAYRLSGNQQDTVTAAGIAGALAAIGSAGRARDAADA